MNFHRLWTKIMNEFWRCQSHLVYWRFLVFLSCWKIFWWHVWRVKACLIRKSIHSRFLHWHQSCKVSHHRTNKINTLNTFFHVNEFPRKLTDSLSREFINAGWLVGSTTLRSQEQIMWSIWLVDLRGVKPFLNQCNM